VTSGRSDWPQIMVGGGGGGGGRHQPVCTPLIRSVPGQQWIMATVAELVGFLLLLYNIHTHTCIYICVCVCVCLFIMLIFIFFNGLAGNKCNNTVCNNVFQ